MSVLATSKTQVQNRLEERCFAVYICALFFPSYLLSKFKYLKGWSFHNLSEQPMLLFDLPHAEKAFPNTCSLPLVLSLQKTAKCWDESRSSNILFYFILFCEFLLANLENLKANIWLG